MNSEYSPPIIISHIQHEKHIRTNHTIKNPSFFDTDKISNDYISNHTEKYYLIPIN